MSGILSPSPRDSSSLAHAKSIKLSTMHGSTARSSYRGNGITLEKFLGREPTWVRRTTDIGANIAHPSSFSRALVSPRLRVIARRRNCSRECSDIRSNTLFLATLKLCDQLITLGTQGSLWPKMCTLVIYARPRMFFNTEDSWFLVQVCWRAHPAP